ncbi:outer-membrane lipoprotein nosL [Brucella melitensis]|nr:outer-membrane lipoprotein nosL [Brucella melitensis]
MKRALFLAPFFFALLAGCSPAEKQEPATPFALTENAMGRYCGMNVLEHPGPKGQIILRPTNEPIWFSSARDTLAFTMLPEEPKNIAAIYVSDMAKAPNWDEPGANNWIMITQGFLCDRKRAVAAWARKKPCRSLTAPLLNGLQPIMAAGSSASMRCRGITCWASRRPSMWNRTAKAICIERNHHVDHPTPCPCRWRCRRNVFHVSPVRLCARRAATGHLAGAGLGRSGQDHLLSSRPQGGGAACR